MLRVLHLIYDDPQNPWVGGGGAVRVFEIYRRLSDRVDVTVATGRYPGSRDETVDRVRYRRLGAPKPYAWSRLSYSIAASRLLARGDYDVAMFDFSTYTLLRIPRDAPVGITVHHLSESTAVERWGRAAGWMFSHLERRTLHRARFFSATSRFMLDHLRTIAGNRARIDLIQAGVPDELFEAGRAESDYLLFFGRMDWFHKGLDIVLDAVAIIAAQRPSIKLKIAGRGRDLDRVARAVSDLGIQRNVELLGAVDDAERARLFAGAQMLLMPSRFEGFGLAAAEAMAAGVPVVASDAGSLPEVVDPPNGGIVVPAPSAKAFAAAITQLLDDPGERQRLSERARVSAERFRWNRIASQHLAFLTAIHESHAHGT